MTFGGRFINEKGKTVESYFEASDEEALRRLLAEKKWRIVSLNKGAEKDEIASPKYIFRGSWIVLSFLIRVLWKALQIAVMIVGFPIAFLTVLLGWIGKTDKEKSHDKTKAIKEAEKILKGTSG